MLKIIAELCQNHNGSIDTLLGMVNSAKKSGATFAKIQALYSDELVYRPQFEDPNPGKFGMFRPYNLEKTRLANLDLTLEDEKKFVSHCENIGIIPMITVFTDKGVERAKIAGFRHIKIASYDCTNFDLINQVSNYCLSLHISTGATSISEITDLANFLKKLKFSKVIDITILHCRTEYPNKLNSLTMNRMKWLSTLDFPVGFSDHSEVFSLNGKKNETHNLASKVAINMGASVIERHFSILDPLSTKDGRISASPTDIKELINFSLMSQKLKDVDLEGFEEEVLLIAGTDDFEPTVEEWWNRKYYKGRVKSNSLKYLNAL